MDVRARDMAHLNGPNHQNALDAERLLLAALNRTTTIM